MNLNLYVKIILNLYISVLVYFPVWCTNQNYHTILFKWKFYFTNIPPDFQTSVVRLKDVSLIMCAQYAAATHHQWMIYKRISRLCFSNLTGWPTAASGEEPANYALYISEAFKPTTCLDVKMTENRTQDGEYWLTPIADQMLGCTIRVYCRGMASVSPREFITLPNPNEGEYPNLSNVWCIHETQHLLYNGVGQQGHYFFNKVAVEIKTMTVIQDDYTFVNITEGKVYPYGHARDCYAGSGLPCGYKGNFHINTLGTGLMFHPQLKWIGTGRIPKIPRVNRSADDAKIDIFCGGSCGGCRPAQPLTLYPSTPNDVGSQIHGAVLQQNRQVITP